MDRRLRRHPGHLLRIAPARGPARQHQPGAAGGRLATDRFAEDALRTVVGDAYGEVRPVAELQRALTGQVRIPEHILSAGEQDGPSHVGPAELPAAAGGAARQAANSKWCRLVRR